MGPYSPHAKVHRHRVLCIQLLLLTVPFIPPGEGGLIYQSLPYRVSKSHLCLRSRHVLTRFPGSPVPLRRLEYHSLVPHTDTGSRCGILGSETTPLRSSLWSRLAVFRGFESTRFPGSPIPLRCLEYHSLVSRTDTSPRCGILGSGTTP